MERKINNVVSNVDQELQVQEGIFQKELTKIFKEYSKKGKEMQNDYINVAEKIQSLVEADVHRMCKIIICIHSSFELQKYIINVNESIQSLEGNV